MTAPAPQQTPVIRSAYRATGSQENATITTGADTAVGDVLVAFHAADWDTAAELTTPTGTAGTWRLIGLADRGTNMTHLKVWDRKVAGTGPVGSPAGAQRVTVGYADDCDVILIVLVLDGATLADAWWEAWVAAVGVASASHVAGSVSPVGTADLLITAHATSDSATSNKPVATYTRPTGTMSGLRQGSAPVAADSVSSDEWVTLGVFTEARTAAGATGTRTAVSNVSRPWAAVTLAFRGATMAVPVYLDGTPARHRWTVQPGELGMTGTTYDAQPSRARWVVEPGQLTHEMDSSPIAITTRVAGPTTLERELEPHDPPHLRIHPVESVLDNMTGQPVRTRWTVQGGELTWKPVVPQVEQRRPTMTRPRKRLRFYAQRVLDRQMLSQDLGLAEPVITPGINTACQITGKVAANELRDLGIDEWATWIHAELDGTIRGSGMLTPFSWGGPEIEIVASGVTRYPHGISYEGDYGLRGETGIVGVQVDPLAVVRHVWDHALSYADGRIGAILSPASSTVRIGEPEKQTVTMVDPAAGTTGGTTSTTTGTTPKTAATTSTSTSNTPATGAANTATEAAENTTGPYILKWWEDTDCGKVIDDLQKSTPFDYREAPYWNADRSSVIQYVELGYPRLGRDLTADGIVFAEGENLTKALTPVENDDQFATEVIVLGKGEGTARIRGRYGARVRNRVRRTVVVEKKDCSTTAMATAYARAEWNRRQSLLSFDEIELKFDHRNAPFGSFSVGDDIPVRAKVQGFGQVFIKHRVMSLAWNVKAGTLTAKTARSDTISYGSSAAVA